MKELSTVIEVTHLRSGDVKKILAEQFTFEVTPEKTEAGIAFNCSKDIAIEKLDKTTRERFSTPQSCIVKFKDNTNQFYVIGEKNLPAKVTINNLLNSDSLSLECKMLTNPFNI